MEGENKAATFDLVAILNVKWLVGKKRSKEKSSRKIRQTPKQEIFKALETQVKLPKVNVPPCTRTLHVAQAQVDSNALGPSFQVRNGGIGRSNFVERQLLEALNLNILSKH